MKASFHALLALLAAALMLAACGGSQNAAMPQGVEAQGRAHKGSRSSGDLLFTSGLVGHNGATLLFSYPKGRFIEGISGAYGGTGMCSDKSGNVWEASGNYIYEFDHNGNYLTSLKDDLGLGAWGCAVDPTTGNVAVTTEGSEGILVFTHGSDYAIFYSTPALNWGWFCGYDADGNLFADGTFGYSGQGQLEELPKGAASVTPIYLDHSIVGSGAVQWDGQYVAVEAAEESHGVTIYQISVSGSVGTIISSTELTTPKENPNKGKQFWIQDGKVLRSIGGPDDREIGIWQYPQGGEPKRFLSKSGKHISRFGGLTVSVAPSK